MIFLFKDNVKRNELNKMELSDASSKPRSKKKIIFFIASLCILILTLSLISIEFFSLLIIKKLGYNWEPAYLKYIKNYQSSNLYGGRTEYHSWGQWNVPNYKGRVINNCFSVTYQFNSHGARDRERSLTGKDRTLVFGDSFIEGWGINQDKTLTAYLEKISGREFLNFGIAEGFSVLNEYILYKDFASKFEHDSVIVALTIGNDFADNNPDAWKELVKIYYRPFWKLSEDKKDLEIAYYAPRVKGKFVPGLDPKEKPLDNTIDWKEFSAFMQISTFIKDYDIYFSKNSAGSKITNYDLNYSDDSITAVLLSYDKFSKLIGDKKKYVIVLPSATDVFYYAKNTKQESKKFKIFKQKLENQGWRVINVLDAFKYQHIDSISDYFICDGHPSTKGNELVAKFIYEQLQ